MPRGPPNYYHFKIHTQTPSAEGSEPIITTHYFSTGYEAADFLGCSRPTLFKLIRCPEECMLSKHFVAEKCRVPKYEKVQTANIKQW